MGYCRLFPAILFILLVLYVVDSEGKRGCANFGHSCYGGMGKRVPKELTQFPDARQNQGEILIGSRFFSDKPYVKLKMNRLQYQQLSRILRQWLEKDGFAVIDNLFTASECEEMIREIRRIIQTTNNATKKVIFKASAANDAPQSKEKYFLDSAHKISLFYEEGSVDSNGELAVAEEYLALNKIGHALHALNEVFTKYTFDDRIKNICRKLDLVDPKVCQSMFIFKNPRIGGEVNPHQDASYLHTSPQSLYGIWIALEDATLDNGCLWFHKGSHKGTLFKRLIRNPDENSDNLTIYTGENIDFNEENYVPVSVNKGSCVVIHGKVLHFSKPNKSPISRNIYTFHVYDDHNTKFSEENWTQPTENSPYLSVYKN